MFEVQIIFLFFIFFEKFHWYAKCWLHKLIP